MYGRWSLNKFVPIFPLEPDPQKLFLYGTYCFDILKDLTLNICLFVTYSHEKDELNYYSKKAFHWYPTVRENYT